MLTNRAIILIVVLGLQFVASERPENCFNADGQDDKIICVCNEDFCDYLTYDFPTKSGDGDLIQTTKDGERFTISKLKSSTSKETRANDLIEIDLSQRFQSILGWGGAFTDAAGIVVSSLSKRLQNIFIDTYFGIDGLRYSMGRVPIGGSDFSPRSYTYDDLADGETDFNLTKWDLPQEDYLYKLPYIKKAQFARSIHSDQKIKLFGSPWSPPAWMKDNNNLTRGHLIDDPQFYQSYANYLVKFYTTYEHYGFKFWGGTVQNEPASANSPEYFFNSLQLDSRQTAKFVGQYLGPTLERNGYSKDKFKLMVGDDNLGLINDLVPTILDDLKARQYISGLAYHWYDSGWLEPYDKLTDLVREINSSIDFALSTEACNGWRKHKEPPVILGSWERGESYAVDIIQGILRQSAGWIDWNIALDMHGGPNWVNNTVDSPIIVDTDNNKFYKQPMFYVLGHFSRFFLPGSVRVGTTPFTKNLNDTMMIAAVHDETGNTVVVNVLNRLKDARTVSLNIKDSNTVTTLENIRLAPNSINTIVLKL